MIAFDSFIYKLKNILKSSKLNSDELFLLSSNYYKDDKTLYNIIMSFAKNNPQKFFDIPTIKKEDLIKISKASDSLYRKIEQGELDE